MDEESARAPTWWGSRHIEEGQGGSFRVGAMKMWIAHFPGEWRVALKHEDVVDDEEISVRCPDEIVDPPDGATLHRFATKSADTGLTIEPILADRSVVARPEIPFNVLPDDEARLFLSIAVWVRLSVRGTTSTLLEVPTIRLSDSWFGATTREGEICYASRTAARMNLANVVRRSTRAITSVVVRNRAEDRLSLERIALPVPALSLFGDVDGNLWTEEVTVERDREGHTAQVKLGRRPPKHAKKPIKVSGARVPEAQNVIVRALHSLLR